MFQRSIYSNQCFCSSAEEHAAVFFHQERPAPVMRGEIKVSRLHEMIADAVHDLVVISLAQVRHQDAHRQRTAVAQGTRQKAWLVVEFSRRGFNPLAGYLGNRTAGYVIQNHRNRSRIQAQMGGQFFQARGSGCDPPFFAHLLVPFRSGSSCQTSYFLFTLKWNSGGGEVREKRVPEECRCGFTKSTIQTAISAPA